MLQDVVAAYLRKTGKAIEDYSSTEALLIDFIEYLETLTLED